MKHEFFQPRFTGARFEAHSLPLEVLRDLTAYESLVMELAKHLYLQDHPDRKRVPKGFLNGVSLHLDQIEEGSTCPSLSYVTGKENGFVSEVGRYLERARDLVTQCVGAAIGSLPSDFPNVLLQYFNQLGKSLKPDEGMEFSSNGLRAVLNQSRRRQLVLAASEVYEKEFSFVGCVSEVDAEKGSLRIRTVHGNHLVIPMPEGFLEHARKILGNQRTTVLAKGAAKFDAWERMTKVLSTESIEIQEDFQLVQQLDELSTLEDGWLDGIGRAPSGEGLDRLGELLVGNYPERLPYPGIFPTEVGNLLFEWRLEGSPSLDLNLEDFSGYFHAFDPEKQDIEKELNLSQIDGWKQLFHLIQQTQNLYRK